MHVSTFGNGGVGWRFRVTTFNNRFCGDVRLMISYYHRLHSTVIPIRSFAFLFSV
jgi:hypothetical protein